VVKRVDFWDSRAESYAKSPIRDEETYQEKLEVTHGYFNFDSQVFEFGCGTGTTAMNHAPFIGKIVATDISPKMIEIAKQKAKDAGIDNVEFQCATLENFFGGRCFLRCGLGSQYTAPDGRPRISDQIFLQTIEARRRGCYVIRMPGGLAFTLAPTSVCRKTFRQSARRELTETRDSGELFRASGICGRCSLEALEDGGIYHSEEAS
jgi:SAM-dependent methyltransferase